MRFVIVAHGETETNLGLIKAAPPSVVAEIVPPSETRGRLGPRDVALARLDVLDTVDGIEPGVWEIARLQAEGVHVMNPLQALLATHDKLLTARLLSSGGVPHPRTRHVSHTIPASLEPPLVLKPRFGSWGTDVYLCRTRAAARACLDELATRSWFQRQGVLVQELVPPLGRDLRIVVAAGQVVGAVERVAAAGEWRTNVALGGVRRPTRPPRAARQLALAAVALSGAHLVGVDLVPTRDGGWVVLELNGAVEFNSEYSLGRDVFAAAADALVALAVRPRRERLAAVG